MSSIFVNESFEVRGVSYTAILKGTIKRYRLLVYQNVEVARKRIIGKEVYIADSKGREGKDELLTRLEEFKKGRNRRKIKIFYENLEK